MSSQIDKIIKESNLTLRGITKPSERLRAREIQVEAMSMRYDIEDLPLCKKIIEEIRDGFAKDAYKGAQQVTAFDTLELAYCIAGFWDFDLYLIGLEFRRNPEKRFWEPRRSILKPIADEITNLVVHGKYDILVLNLPPRVGKSTMGVMACIWAAGREPEKQNLLSGYASALTDSFYKEMKNIILDDEYNFKKVFRDVKFMGSSAEWTLIDLAPKDTKRDDLARYPTLACRAIGGSLNGQVEAANILYCDDLTRGYEEALSIDQMDKLYAQYSTDLIGRAKEGFKQFHIGTRWSVHDPLGRIIESNKDNPRVKVIQIPALDPETDESNFQYEGGVGFSTEFYKERRRVLMEDKENNGPVSWLCLYQQEPIERGSIAFPEEELLRIDNIDFIFDRKSRPDEMIAFVDVSFGGKDYLSMPIGAVYNGMRNGEQIKTVYIVDWLFINKAGYDVTEPLVAGMIRKWNVTRVVFEANNGGDFYGRDVEDLLKKDGGEPVFVTNRLSAGNQTKLNRIEANTPAILQFVFLDRMCYNDMYRLAIRHLTTFSRDGNNKNDDAPDSLAGLAAMVRTTSVNKIQVIPRRYI